LAGSNGGQDVAADAARKADTSIVAVHHAAIASCEGDQGHQVAWQVDVSKVRLETE
jgi:hypothetical protein